MSTIVRLLAALCAAAAVLPAHAIYKCTMLDGRVIYSDTPCQVSSKESKTVDPQRPVVPQHPVASTPPSTPAQARQIAPPTKIAFTGVPRSDLIKASALMDNIRLKGRDCEWALKVDKAKMMSACTEFLGKLQPNGEFQQVGERVNEVLRDRAAAQESIDELRRLLRYTEDIVRYKEFALANLGITTR